MLGRTTFNTSKSSSSILNSIKNTVQKDVNAAISDVAKALNIHDFYSAHILDYCEVRRILSCLAGKEKVDTEPTVTTGLLHSDTCHKFNLSAVEEHYLLLQRNFFLPLRPGSRNPERAQAWRQSHRSEMAICN